jgi:tRNA A37 threonylcarbamoyladenosine biosynthesis protein TsaE
MKETELFTLTATESNLSEVIIAITKLIEEKSVRIFWFSGDLGAGKTTLIRSLVKYLGYPGIVGSPTYGLVNTYDLEINSTHFHKSTNITDPTNNKTNNQFDNSISDLNQTPNKVNTDVSQRLNNSISDLNQTPNKVNSDVSQRFDEINPGNQRNPLKHKRIHHSDWYRIESIDELYDSGIEEELHEGNDIWLIEWAEMGLEVLKSLPVIKIEIEASSPTSPRTYRFLMV